MGIQSNLICEMFEILKRGRENILEVQMIMTKREEYLNLSKKALGDKYIFTDELIPIGQGGSGIVYVINQVFGRDENIISKRAVKFFIFRDDLMENWGVVSVNNFQTEIKNITQFSHQNILKVIDGDFYKININDKVYEIPYTITEYVEGDNLEELFQSDKLYDCKNYIKNEEVVFNIFIDIIDAIQYLHNKSFYHCDIAPKNIFLKMGEKNDVFAILGDLGAGNTVDNKVSCKIRVIGTYEYMPTEVKNLKNQEISGETFATLQPAWDIYSVIHTMEVVVEQIERNNIISGNIWNLKMLIKKITSKKYANIEELREDVEYLKPSSGQIFNLDELSEASSKMRPCLIPCDTAMLSYRMKKLTKHDCMLRLMEVPQLLEGATTFPGANHTRYEHSLGTYELMRQAILALLRNKDYIIYLSEKQVILALLGALLSSLTNFPYSYAIQELRVQNPELFSELERKKLFQQLINQKSDLSQKSLMECIHELFPQYDIQEGDISYVIFGKSGVRKQELDNLNLLLNSSIGVRIVDYIIRDAHHIGISCRIETDNLFNNLAIIDDEFCLKQGGVSSAEQIITNRSWMFKRIYWSDPNRANAALLKYLFYVVYCEQNNIDQLIATEVKQFICTKMSIQTILLDACSEEKKQEVRSIIDFINHKGQRRYKSMLVLDKNSKFKCANQTCERFAKLSYKEQFAIREELEKWLLKRYDFSKEEVKEGVVLLLDIPAENMDNKIGKDIRVMRHDKSILTLDKVSGLVNGMRDNYEEQLKILRVYIRPDIYDKIIEDKNYSKEEVGKEMNEILYKLL